jgi:hypothetical protein
LNWLALVYNASSRIDFAIILRLCRLHGRYWLLLITSLHYQIWIAIAYTCIASTITSNDGIVEGIIACSQTPSPCVGVALNYRRGVRRVGLTVEHTLSHQALIVLLTCSIHHSGWIRRVSLWLKAFHIKFILTQYNLYF